MLRMSIYDPVGKCFECDANSEDPNQNSRRAAQSNVPSQYIALAAVYFVEPAKDLRRTEGLDDIIHDA